VLLDEFIDSLHIGRFDVMGLSAGSPYCYALAAALYKYGNFVTKM
jgi:hypothetical protein